MKPMLTLCTSLVFLTTACGPEDDSDGYNDWGTTYTPPPASSSRGGGSSNSSSTGQSSSSQVCVYKRDSRMTCPGVTSAGDETWLCRPASTLAGCKEETRGSTDCFESCCTEDWTWGHQLMTGTCQDALAKVKGTGSSSGSTAGSTQTNTCHEFRESCAADGACCDGLVCVQWSSSSVTCGYSCTHGSQCASGCCAALDGGGGVCAKAEYCQ